jgi:uncharacterized membrane protein YhaH (DUF805 family)
MDFITAIKTCLSKYADFNGRARRSEFWYWYLFNFIVGLVLGWIPVVGWLISIALLIPNLAVAARRLHDTGRSGWWQLLNLIPLIGAIVLIVWWAQDSHAGENEYGVNPKA